MKALKRLGCAGALALAGAAPAQAQSAACDRACLADVADAVIASIVRHEPGSVPVAPQYKATENGVPAALSMMTIWRTASGASNRFLVIDPSSGQLFMAVTIREGNADSLLFGRLRVADRKVTEIELYTGRSRSDGGFQFDATQLANQPLEWTQPVERTRLPNRAALLEAGRAMFDITVASPPPAPACVLMENGKIVAEDPEVLKAIMPPPPPGAPAPPPRPLNADGTVSIPCGIPPDRPTDSAARTEIIDEAQGIVVSIATVEGVVAPYLITAPTESAFVPTSFLPPYAVLLEAQKASGRYTLPAIVETKATVTVAQVHRIYDGKLQGMHLFEKVGPVGAKSPWVGE